jgi:hypothetical protein
VPGSDGRLHACHVVLMITEKGQPRLLVGREPAASPLSEEGPSSPTEEEGTAVH